MILQRCAHPRPCYDDGKCHYKGECKHKAPLTNADHIRAMTDDELNNFLRKVAYCMDKCPYEYGGKKSLGWLQQPAEGDGNA